MQHGVDGQGLRATSAGALVALLSATILPACALHPTDDVSTDAAVDAIVDAGPSDTADDCTCPSCDASSDGAEVDGFDAVALPPQIDGPQYASMELPDGGTATGEWVATYNHNYWWNDAGAELTYALFDVDRLAQYPDDRSFRFLSSNQTQKIELLPWPSGRTRYRDALRVGGLTLPTTGLPGIVHVITANDSYHLEEDGYGDFAFDLVKTDEQGSRFMGDGSENEDFLVWGTEVRCPVVGIVVEVERSMEDNDPGGFTLNAPANRIGISIGGSFYVYLYHFRKDSIPDSIEVGDTLFAGTTIGQVGNSGMSDEPHLHVVMLWYDEDAEEPRSWGVPFEFENVEVASTPTGPFVRYDFFAPPARSWIRSDGSSP